MLLTGYDNRFGHNRNEGFDDYVRYGHELGIEVRALPAEGTVSSSHVRKLLQEGLVSEAAECLGYPYRISGIVTHGEHIGTGLGFPTANLEPDEPLQLIPASGVYAVRCGEMKGMMNIGTRPTFGEHPQTLEVHLLDYHGNLYGQQLTIEFICRLRGEQHFDSAESLIEQLKKDAIQAKQLL
jgi:riboflavin kinase/FMN adenylyltransferase